MQRLLCSVMWHHIICFMEESVACLHLQRFQKIVVICIPYLILLSDKIEEGEFGEIFGKHDKD